MNQHICVISSASTTLVKFNPLITSVSPFNPSPPSFDSVIVPSVTPPAVRGTLRLLISDVSHNSRLHLPFPSPLSLFHSLHSICLPINSSLVLRHISSLSQPLPPPINSSPISLSPLNISQFSTCELCTSTHE